MRVVITGGYGYIGSRIANHLIANGHEVRIIDNLRSSVSADLPDCELLQGDITDYETLKTIKARGFDALLHLAAQSSGPLSAEIPDVDIKINVLGTLNMIKWCRDNNIPRMVFASSFVVYGDHSDKEQLREDDSCEPKSIYALSKHTCEQLLRIYATPLGVNWNVLRMFNVYGVGQDLKRSDQGMVSIFLNLVKNNDYIPVKGRLDRFRDLIYIEDVVQGWEKCLLNDQHPNEIYNLGTGTKSEISTLIETLIDALGKTGKVMVEEVGETPGDIAGCFADIRKISTDLRYRPQYDLRKGVHKMVEWARTID
ncbi:MAG: NAD-dependent epimerase/dehydratase family protein [Calditrichaeota bacterium]|nr:NAD-dependent epimerase/dehydratase family protein [Calditrichota bacterium]